MGQHCAGAACSSCADEQTFSQMESSKEPFYSSSDEEESDFLGATADHEGRNDYNQLLDRVTGERSIHRAVKDRNVHYLQFLIKNNSDINCQTHRDKMTPLHIAAEMNDRELIRLLLDHQANPLARNKDGKMPHELCIRSLKIEFKRALEQIVNARRHNIQATQFTTVHSRESHISHSTRSTPSPSPGPSDAVSGVSAEVSNCSPSSRPSSSRASRTPKSSRTPRTARNSRTWDRSRPSTKNVGVGSPKTSSSNSAVGSAARAQDAVSAASNLATQKAEIRARREELKLRRKRREQKMEARMQQTRKEFETMARQTDVLDSGSESDPNDLIEAPVQMHPSLQTVYSSRASVPHIVFSNGNSPNPPTIPPTPNTTSDPTNEANEANITIIETNASIASNASIATNGTTKIMASNHSNSSNTSNSSKSSYTASAPTGAHAPAPQQAIATNSSESGKITNNKNNIDNNNHNYDISDLPGISTMGWTALTSDTSQLRSHGYALRLSPAASYDPDQEESLISATMEDHEVVFATYDGYDGNDREMSTVSTNKAHFVPSRLLKKRDSDIFEMSVNTVNYGNNSTYEPSRTIPTRLTVRHPEDDDIYGNDVKSPSSSDREQSVQSAHSVHSVQSGVSQNSYKSQGSQKSGISSFAEENGVNVKPIIKASNVGNYKYKAKAKTGMERIEMEQNEQKGPDGQQKVRSGSAVDAVDWDRMRELQLYKIESNSKGKE